VGEDDLMKACHALVESSPHRSASGARTSSTASSSSTPPHDGLILFHAELDKHDLDDHPHRPDASTYSTFLESRPPSWELDALELILKLANQFPTLRFHIVHLSAAEAIPRIQHARLSKDQGGQGLSNLTVETCLHYLTLRAEDIPPNATQFKCCPPIRSEANRKALCGALLDGTIDFVISDHSPCVPELKKGDFMTAWGGVSGLGLGLSLMYTEFGKTVELGKIVDWMGESQARQLGIQGKKGSLVKGADADFAVFDPTASYTVDTVSVRPILRPNDEFELYSYQAKSERRADGRTICCSRTKYRHTLARHSQVSCRRHTSGVS
jgi:allantoinase